MSSYWDNAKAYYSTAHWKQLSHSCKVRDGWRCKGCGDVAETINEKRAFHAHHKIPRRPLPYPTASDRLDNLISLCDKCHSLRHGRNLVVKKSSIPRIGNKMFRVNKFRRF